MGEHGNPNQIGHVAAQASSGGDTSTLAKALSKLPGKKQGHGFLSQLLGLENEPRNTTSSSASATSSAAGWTTAMQSLKVSDAMQGINVTPNFLFILLFAGLTSWLFVIYWIRHHEPLANSVLGTGAARSATAAADRRLIGGVKYALPFHTSATTGDFYVPTPGAQPISSMPPFPGPPVPPQPAPNPEPMPLSAGPVSAAQLSPYPYMSQAQAPMPTYFQGYPQTYGASTYSHRAYSVPVTEGTGTRVKMIVNR